MKLRILQSTFQLAVVITGIVAITWSMWDYQTNYQFDRDRRTTEIVNRFRDSVNSDWENRQRSLHEAKPSKEQESRFYANGFVKTTNNFGSMTGVVTFSKVMNLPSFPRYGFGSVRIQDQNGKTNMFWMPGFRSVTIERRVE